MKRKREFQIQCGEHSGIVRADSIGKAWRKLTKGKTKGFAPLVRWTECYKGLPWFYQTPQSLDKIR